MALVKFVSTSLDAYSALTTKDAGTLYSLSNGQLYKGDKLVHNVQLVSTFPSPGINHTLYINPTTGEMRYYDEGYVIVTRPFVTVIDENSSNSQTPSAAAVKNYVDNQKYDFNDSKYIKTNVDDDTNTVTHSFVGPLDIGDGGHGGTTVDEAWANLAIKTAAKKNFVDSVDGSDNLPTAKAVQAAIASSFAANDAMIFKGTITTSASSSVTATQKGLPTTYQVGWTYRVVEAGTLAGQAVEIGDLITAIVDRSGSGNANSDWTIVQTNINGAITNLVPGAKISISGDGSSKTIAHTTVSIQQEEENLTPNPNGIISVVAGVRADDTGHVTGIETANITLPNDLDEKVKQTASTESSEIPVLLATSASPTSGQAASANYATSVKVKPSEGAVIATTFRGALDGNAKTATNATSATQAQSANKLNTNAGGVKQPVYFANGVPVAITETVGTGQWPVWLNQGVVEAVSKITTDLLINGSNTLILDGNF